MKKKILISAYAISPVRGSEYAAAWNTVINLADQHELWVIYGMSDDHMGQTKTLESYIANNPCSSIKFIKVQAGIIANTINLLNKAGLGWFFYLAYYLWQKKALKAAQQIIKTADIDVVHQLGPIGFREPGLLAKLGKPIVWGPIGGMKLMEKRFLLELPLIDKIKYSLKNYINRYQLGYSPRIKRAFQDVDVLIAATLTGKQTISTRFARESYYLPEQGISSNITTCLDKLNNMQKQVRFVWSGSLIRRKNLKMCLDALSTIKQSGWRLDVLGDGPLRKELEKFSFEKGLTNKVFFLGHIPRQEAIRVMANAHLHIMTSIAEDNPAVIFEAMANGVPTLTIDHCGMSDVICCKCGVKIPLDDHDKMLQKMTLVLDILLSNTKILTDLHQTTLICAEEHKWLKRLELLNGIYDEAIAVHGRHTIYGKKNKKVV
ncbi:glycosyltransferase [Mucilaginibacter phyllosphaerae]